MGTCAGLWDTKDLCQILIFFSSLPDIQGILVLETRKINDNLSLGEGLSFRIYNGSSFQNK